MAKLAPYVAISTAVGQKVKVKAKIAIIWKTVGRGVIATFDDYQVNLGGTIDILGYNGDLIIDLQLTDQDFDAPSGPCILRLNDHTDHNARYKANSKAMTVMAELGGYEQNISILRVNNGTQTECKLFGKVNQTVHLDPGS